MAKQRGPRPPRWRVRLVRGVVLAVCLALVAATAVVTYRRERREPARISVRVVASGHDRRVLIDEGEPVAAALLEADALGHDGRLLSAKEGTVLDAHHDPAVLTVDGGRVDPASVPLAGDVVEIVDGTDVVEGTRTTVEVVQPPPLPAVLRHVQERGKAGRTRRVVGTVSGDVVSTTVLEAPVPPRQTTRKVVAFTFDDGPSTKWTGKVLAILRAKKVHATFCQVGSQVDAHPEISKAVVRQGHQLCNHTLDHDEGMVGEPQSRLDAQIVGGAEAFADHELPTPRYFRPPGGFLSDAITTTATGQGEQTLYWKVDTEDWRKGADAFTILQNLLDQVDRGAIILMHDGGGKDRHETLVALGLAIDYLRGRGWSFVFPITDRLPAKPAAPAKPKAPATPKATATP